MKNNIVKNILKAIAATAMAATIFISTGKEANALTLKEFAKYVMDLPVSEIKKDPMLMAEYAYWKNLSISDIYAGDSIVSTVNTPQLTPLTSQSSFDYIRYAADYPDLAAAFGKNRNALYQHYITCGINEGRNAYYTNGTAIAMPGVSVSHPEMLALVNADRAIYGSHALVWSADLETVAIQRAKATMDNYKSEAYKAAKLAGNHELQASIVHSGCGDEYGENFTTVMYGYADNANFANIAWIKSADHHENRVDTIYTLYAAASYVDPVTLEEVWVEIFF